MKKTHAIFAIIVALGVGFAGGYFSHIIRYPIRHKHPELFADPKAAEAPVVVHPITLQVEKARKLLADGKNVEAQQLLREQIRIYPQAPEARPARELLGAINTEMFFRATIPTAKPNTSSNAAIRWRASPAG